MTLPSETPTTAFGLGEYADLEVVTVCLSCASIALVRQTWKLCLTLSNNTYLGVICFAMLFEKGAKRLKMVWEESPQYLEMLNALYKGVNCYF